MAGKGGGRKNTDKEGGIEKEVSEYQGAKWGTIRLVKVGGRRKKGGGAKGSKFFFWEARKAQDYFGEKKWRQRETP